MKINQNNTILGLNLVNTWLENQYIVSNLHIYRKTRFEVILEEDINL